LTPFLTFLYIFIIFFETNIFIFFGVVFVKGIGKTHRVKIVGTWYNGKGVHAYTSLLRAWYKNCTKKKKIVKIKKSQHNKKFVKMYQRKNVHSKNDVPKNITTRNSRVQTKQEQ